MARIWKLTIELRTIDPFSDELEFAVKEVIRTGRERPVCTLQVGKAVRAVDIEDLEQIIDDCVLSSMDRTLGTHAQLPF